ncbi:hypothetical protein S7711_11115 [Stachybotrys chartarum IBT 7711]|uniref:Uncharacterized protein n=1 Tax=Stachybotrys chartarum (strain CBS 109288 / IBT 7711) TaxID=1280523 RepID=A0A084AP83_STACB|nr:hypothetical protein S7711_11115 [Stachybotrys chartarum IBT 7711]KFA52119.1 hypothetical protein S40293_10660 [Stachybotrys chartarum IBT 40293]
MPSASFRQRNGSTSFKSVTARASHISFYPFCGLLAYDGPQALWPPNPSEPLEGCSVQGQRPWFHYALVDLRASWLPDTPGGRKPQTNPRAMLLPNRPLSALCPPSPPPPHASPSVYPGFWKHQSSIQEWCKNAGQRNNYPPPPLRFLCALPSGLR